MRTLLPVVALAAGLLSAAPASALVLTGVRAPGGNLVTTSEISNGQISVDFDIFSFNGVLLDFTVQAGDLDSYAFDSVINIFTGRGPLAEGVSTLTLALNSGATFTQGLVAPAFSTATSTPSAGGELLTIRFAPAETTGLELGSVQGSTGDFAINRNGLAAGQSFTLGLFASPVPEPATWASLIAGFGLLGTTLRRSRRRTTMVAA